jgi:hypothetical protein
MHYMGAVSRHVPDVTSRARPLAFADSNLLDFHPE